MNTNLYNLKIKYWRNSMDNERRKKQSSGSGMKLVRGGIEIISQSDVRGGGCVCSPRGYLYGKEDPCGCACGCFGPSSPMENRNANDSLGNPE
jgi:hypothetical protein